MRGLREEKPISGIFRYSRFPRITDQYIPKKWVSKGYQNDRAPPKQVEGGRQGGKISGMKTLTAKKMIMRGEVFWETNIPLSVCGRRHRIRRPTKEETLAAAREYVAENQTHGTELASLSTVERAFIVRMRNNGLTMARIEKALEDTSVPKRTSLLDAFNAYLKTQEGNCYGHVTSLKSCFNLFSKAYPNRSVESITAGDIATYMLAHKSNERAIYRRLRAFFRWASMMDLVIKNPIERVQRPGGDTSEREIFTCDQMQALLNAAAENAPVLRFLVFGGFFGLRTAEIQRLQCSDVDLRRGEVFVRNMKTKARGMRERYVSGTPTALAWLAILHLPATGPVIEMNESNLRLNRDAVIAKANGDDVKAARKPGAKAKSREGKLIQWPFNVLRRSFASYHLAAFENPNLTATLMGHTTADTTFAKYRAVRRKEDGEAWFALLP